jgi:hypothetical protein
MDYLGQWRASEARIKGLVEAAHLRAATSNVLSFLLFSTAKQVA